MILDYSIHYLQNKKKFLTRHTNFGGKFDQSTEIKQNKWAWAKLDEIWLGYFPCGVWSRLKCFIWGLQINPSNFNFEDITRLGLNSL